jgi:hypothetical protein
MICWDLGSDSSMLILLSTYRKIYTLAAEISIVLGKYLFARKLVSSDIDCKGPMNTSET